MKNYMYWNWYKTGQWIPQMWVKRLESFLILGFQWNVPHIRNTMAFVWDFLSSHLILRTSPRWMTLYNLFATHCKQQHAIYKHALQKTQTLFNDTILIHLNQQAPTWHALVRRLWSHPPKSFHYYGLHCQLGLEDRWLSPFSEGKDILRLCTRGLWKPKPRCLRWLPQ